MNPNTAGDLSQPKDTSSNSIDSNFMHSNNRIERESGEIKGRGGRLNTHIQRGKDKLLSKDLGEDQVEPDRHVVPQ